MEKTTQKDLKNRIMLRIERRERQVLAWKAAGFGAALAGSLSFVAFGFANLLANLSQSGFLQFVSLFFSDFSTAMANFQDFAFSLIESFPVIPAILLLVGIVATVWTAAGLLSDVAQLYSSKIYSGTTIVA